MNITFTGVDEQTNLQYLRSILRPGMEIGILATLYPTTRCRYPRLEWIDEAVLALAPYGSVHFCGEAIRTPLMKTDRFDKWFSPYGAHRLQVNGVVGTLELHLLCHEFSHRRVITQHNPRNEQIANIQLDNHDLLVDESGGEGKLPEVWKAPITRLIKPIGFAGGLNSETLPEAYHQIRKIAGYQTWLDMETGVRNSADWFCLDRMAEVLDTLEALDKQNA